MFFNEMVGSETSMFSLERLDKKREYIYHLLNRMKKFNCPVSIHCEFDITDTMQAIEDRRAQGRPIGFMAYLTKATANAMAIHPHFNNRLYHTLFGKRVVTYDQINCGLLVERETPEGKHTLLPLNIYDAPNQSVEDIHHLIKDYKTKPIEEIKAYRQLSKLDRIPRWVIPIIHFMMRTHPGYNGNVGNTYAISSVLQRNGAAVGVTAPAYKTTFFPINIIDKPVVYKGEVVIRTMLQMMISVDHYLADGMDVLRASGTLKDFLENPSTLLE